jgi:hypothetical protein
MTYKVKSPVLFLIFNRPKESQLVFNAIKEAKPFKLYIAADGPRTNKNDDNFLCTKTRDIIKGIDWDCQIETLFQDENLGCKIAVSTAISWFFEKETEGIILEDDCLPSQKFFQYCDVLLEKYRHDTRIRHISGCSMGVGDKSSPETYYFSKMTNVWGWASWRRVWQDYDVELKLYSKSVQTSLYKNVFNDDFITEYIFKQFKLVHHGYINTWDYQYAFCNIINNGLSINPNYNMISNIGFNKDATHTTDGNDKLANISLENFETIIHPDIMIPNIVKDIAQLRKQIPSLFKRCKEGIKSFLKKNNF